MQLFCRQEQMKALKSLQEQDKPSAADKINFNNTPNWIAYSTTAINITGDIRFSDEILTFKNGAKSRIKLVQREGNSRLFELKAPDKSLSNGNSICPDNDTNLFMLTTFKDDEIVKNSVFLELTFFDADKVTDIDADNICGTFKYTPSDDQSKFVINENIDQEMQDAGIVDYCTRELGINNPKSKKVLSCVKTQTEALTYLQQAGDFSACVGYSTGYRMLGSMEYIDKVPVVKCMILENPTARFASCVKSVTKKKYRYGTVDWDYEASEKIAKCFNK